MTLTPGTRLGAYEIVALLGTGGMGEVYRAREPRLDRDVAIKILAPGISTDPHALHRFQQEARAAAALNHPHIVAVHDTGTHNGSPYIVSQLLEGATLRERLPAGALPRHASEQYVCPFEVTTVHAALGDQKSTLEWLEKGYQERADCMPWVRSDPKLDGLRDYPGFDDLMRRMGFPP